MSQRGGEQTVRVQVGSAVGEGWGVALSVFAQEGASVQVVRAYAAHKKEFAVMTVDARGVVVNSRYTTDVDRSLLLFAEVVLSYLYTHNAKIPPTVTWDRPNPTGRI